MEAHMKLLREAHDEEKNELENIISKLEANVKEENDVESRLARLELSLSQALEYKGLLGGANSRYVSGESATTMEATEPEMTMVNVGGCEQPISVTFGDIDTKPTTLERFISHYKVVNEINTERQVMVWKKPSYRALTLRMALRGPPAVYIEQETNMQQEWVKDDAGILVWQLLKGARDKDVREELITIGRMKDGKDSNEYDEILKIAEGVINKNKVTKAMGKVGCENQVNTVVGKLRKTTPGYVRNKRIKTKAVHSSPMGANWNCFCCKTDEHPGGWRSCPLLGKLYPDWKQGDRPPVFQSRRMDAW